MSLAKHKALASRYREQYHTGGVRIADQIKERRT
jgi:hypothetical protein